MASAQSPAHQATATGSYRYSGQGLPGSWKGSPGTSLCY